MNYQLPKFLGIAAVAFLLTNCAEEPKIMSNEFCHVTYAPSQEKLAKELYQSVQWDLDKTDEQRQFEITDDGDLVNVKYQLGAKEAKNENYCEMVACYLQNNYIRKSSVFSFNTGSAKALFTLKSEELPIEYSYQNASFICDFNVPEADQLKLKKAVADKKVPQEMSYWLKIENGQYFCYYISNFNWGGTSLSQQASDEYGAMADLVRSLNLSKPAEYGAMNLDYRVWE